MTQIRPSTQLAQDGASTNDALIFDGTHWTHGTPVPAAHTHVESDVTNLVTDLANITVLHWMEP